MVPGSLTDKRLNYTSEINVVITAGPVWSTQPAADKRIEPGHHAHLHRFHAPSLQCAQSLPRGHGRPASR